MGLVFFWSHQANVLHQDLDKEAGTVDLSYQQASHFIRPFYSTSRSFLSIVRVPETMPCGEKQAVQVDFRIYQEDLEHGPKRVIFSYFVTGKRGIVHAGQKTVWVGLPRMMKGFFRIPLTFSSIYAPAPRLVVYVLFPNGKIIADSAVFSVSMCFRNKIYGLFPSVYNSRYPHQVSEDDHSCGFPNSDEPDVFTAFRIRVTLEEFAHFQLKPCEGCVYSSCLCASEAKTFQWTVTAEQLGLTNITLSTEAVATEELCGKEIAFVPNQGQKDTITKPLLVRPEGVLVEKAHSSILCPKKGDLMGTALQNLDHLVQMPHGCGEQNMVLFAPIVYVLQYLDKTRQLTPEIKERATGFLRKGNDFIASTVLSTNVLSCFPGYQLQLQYQHPDGSYSEFGTKDEYGNTCIAECWNTMLLRPAGLPSPANSSAGVPGETGNPSDLMVLRYNTPSPEVSTSFAVQVKTEPVNCTKDDMHSVTVYVNVRYTGKRSISNMVIVEVSLLSGFVLAPGSGISVRSLELGW
ncbi:hypothetical protein llap_18613 [Limosa lapponica baueri]|uniref:Alpha-2-macroglobulin bait region domain-containing protein n=1 Tax=Limosa lapponica baueri TaxID=1758121 RepID=A0A2I0TBB1_LIMLA|nr:hypothetical protein llap_18613 [Limosa lapponica baueri]